MLHGQIMDWPLTTSSILRRAAQVFPESGVVTRTVEGGLHRYGYGEAFARAGRLASVLRDELKIAPGERVATLAWNGHRHFEAYYAISGIGAVCHTLNPRYALNQLQYILGHAGDVALLADATFAAMLPALCQDRPGLRAVMLLTDEEHMPEDLPDGALCYEALLANASDDFDWPALDERTAANLCYTSGTTGDPKGALYSHRSLVLHALATIAGSTRFFSESERVLPVVPQFHVNAWGLPFAMPIAGGTLVMPGPRLDGASLFELMDDESVTSAWGVPTIWMGLLAAMRERGRKPKALQRMAVGGAAPPISLITAFERDYGIDVLQGWGMTEMCPVGSLCNLPPCVKDADEAHRLTYKARQGRATYGAELRIVDEAGKPLPHDGVSSGEVQARGFAMIDRYYEDEAATAAAFTADGWLRTGDVGTIDHRGCLQVVDRVKDMIKSGGEWISSIDVENVAMAHPAIAECAVVAVPHPYWQERPLLVAVLRPTAEASEDELRAFLAERVAKISVPDGVVFAEELPHTATGKVAKRHLRTLHEGYYTDAE